MEKDFFLEGIIDRFEDDKAVIIFQDKQEIFWPKKKLPPYLKEGDIIKIKILKREEEKKEKEELAKAILNELLKDSYVKRRED